MQLPTFIPGQGIELLDGQFYRIKEIICSLDKWGPSEGTHLRIVVENSKGHEYIVPESLIKKKDHTEF